MATTSRSAVMVTLARAHLTWMGVVDDPHALAMLPPNGRRAAVAFRQPVLRRIAQHRSIPYLAARTLACDAFVTDALDAGIDQVVVVAAGYDSRAWRLTRPGVDFYEVDQAPTQDVKRTRAPATGGPVYVPADATDPALGELLIAAGLDSDRPTAVLVEGLAIYLEEGQVADLLAGLAGIAPTGSRLAISFERGFDRDRSTRLLATTVYRGSGETFHFRLDAADAGPFLDEAGWTLDRLLTSAELREHLADAPVSPLADSEAFIATATR